ncbi:Pkinase-domain-containing protein [Auriculariales sp. MPI-PUGE-AT-0066]|nr:Pkinase-domain-containing protein [Auriculariales sp. MPI-PUGE-AT-0066]
MAVVANANGMYGQGPSSGPSSQSSSPTSPSFQPHPRVQQQQHGRPSTPNGALLSLEAPPGVSYLDFVRQWLDGHVAAWLVSCRCAAHASVFAENDIRGDVLLDIDQNTLKEMGIASVGDRARIANAIKQLRTKCHTSKLLAAPPRVTLTNSSEGVQSQPLGVTRSNSKRGASSRPPPLTLPPVGSRTDVELVRGTTPRLGVSTPNSAHGTTPINKERPFLPPLPPAPRSNPPQPPPVVLNNGQQLPPTVQTPQRSANLGLPAQPALSGRRTPTPEPPPYTNNPLPAPPGATPGTPGSWHGSASGHVGLPSNPGAYRAMNSPAPVSARGTQAQPLGHNKSGSFSRPPGRAMGQTLEPPMLKTNDLSPIAESFQSPALMTPSRLVPLGSLLHGRPGLDELRRKTIKFYLDDGGNNYRVVNVLDCERGLEVLERVLKKFGRPVSSPIDPDYTVEGGLILDGYGVFYDESIGGGRVLTENQLLNVCRADPDNPARDLGLHVRQVSALRPGQRTRTTTTTSLEEAKKLNRASSLSILSSLGVRDPERTLLSVSSPPSPQQSPSSPSARSKPGQKLRNFFGQRPPSELITNHLAEYFPFTERKILARTQRNSIMRQNTTTSRRDSRVRRDSASQWLPPPASRFSTSTTGSGSRASMETVPPPPVPDKGEHNSPPRVSLSIGDGDVVDLSVDDSDDDKDDKDGGDRQPGVQSMEPLAFPSMERRNSTSSRRSRLSYLSELRRRRDTSDTASMLTVDEITQEVESRRASWIGSASATASEGTTFVHGDHEDEELDNKSIRRSTVDLEVPQPAHEEDDEEDEEEEDEEEDEYYEEDDENEEVDDDEDADETVAESDNSDEKPIKWIRGALIGAGSFGSVYLGMDKVNGTLMAVKQVELPSGSTHNEERKKSMLTALEREIDLLKQLQHENIVQYLDSFMDKQHLNIFLEYVPGGSVTALLNKFGSFEEALVRNFVRQILQGLDYLHTSDIIHRDIKGANILVDNKGGIKISDFGISKKVADNILSTARVHRPSLQGSVFWMAPEVVKQTSYTLKADIWSLGCLVVEMFTGEHPYPKLNQMQAIFKIGMSAKPQTPDDISSDAEEFLGQTFEIDYTKRPSAAELLLHAWIVKDPANLAKKSSKTAASDTS